MNKSIILDGRELSYEFERKNVKNINLRIRSDCFVCVSANTCVADGTIEGFMKKKASYIFSALDKYSEISKYSVNRHNYVTGETFRYLGKDLRLIVAKGKNTVSSDGIYLTLRAMDTSDAILKEKLINKWYDARCREVFIEIITATFPIFQKYGVTMPKLTFRDMSSRWGSCQTKRGIITLNRRLIESPRNAIEYVVMHEFIHFLHPNHSAKFYEILAVMMPDWKTRKKHLEADVFGVSDD